MRKLLISLMFILLPVTQASILDSLDPNKVLVVYGFEAGEDVKELAKELSLKLAKGDESLQQDIMRDDNYTLFHYSYFVDYTIIALGTESSNRVLALAPRWAQSKLGTQKLQSWQGQYNEDYGLVSIHRNPLDLKASHLTGGVMHHDSCLIGLSGNSFKGIKKAYEAFKNESLVSGTLLMNSNNELKRSVVHLEPAVLVSKLTESPLKLAGLNFLAWQQGKAQDYAGIKSLTEQSVKSIVRLNYLDPKLKLRISDLLESKANNSVLKIVFEDELTAAQALHKFQGLGVATVLTETIYELSRNNQKIIFHQVEDTVYLIQLQAEASYKAYLKTNK